MSTISAISSASSTPTTSAAASTVANSKTLGVNDFMKLLATQFQQQDPLKPMDDTAFIAQTAQFTSLQQTNTLVQQMTQLSAAQNQAAANSYLGFQIIVNGQAYPISAVLRVEPSVVSAPQPANSGGA